MPRCSLESGKGEFLGDDPFEFGVGVPGDCNGGDVLINGFAAPSSRSVVRDTAPSSSLQTAAKDGWFASSGSTKIGSTSRGSLFANLGHNPVQTCSLWNVKHYIQYKCCGLGCC